MPFTFEQSKDEIAHLVEHFTANKAAYLSTAYKEAHTRQEFIDPLFTALNWDVRNKQRSAPDYREVIVEDSLDIEGQKKAPDYVFRVGRERKFFAEAKKPGVDLKNNAGPAYQLRRYAWSAKLPLSILTDFEEFAVYDCRPRPADKDKPAVARLNYLTCAEYADRWREIWDVFSRDAVWGGSFDQYAQAGKGKRGASEVDAEFLKEIEGWRDVLARNIAIRNANLTIDELNDAVQRIIDRIIFLRMAEDRGIEEYGRLKHLAEGDGVYAGLLTLSRLADDRYNSGLFDFSKAGDRVTPNLSVDDKTLKPILSGLYYPQSPYVFNVMPAEILGNVYEQFLGKVIRLTAGNRAKVEEKPEVKKAGGVYYTPAYIVEYIVRNTVGRQIEGKSPKQLKGFRVLDMACGSGSFLLGAYQCLLDHYLKWYIENDQIDKGLIDKGLVDKGLIDKGLIDKGFKPLVREGLKPLVNINGTDSTPNWRLTTAEKKRILTEHVFGVDIDRQAVEVTKLSLLLKVLEGENDESLGKQLALLRERALPNLDRNIKCGNSLIGPDYFSGQLFHDDEELRRVNPFDWEAEFPEAFVTQSRYLWFVTFVTHNSRVSERMVTYGVQTGEPLVFTPEDQLLIAEKIFEACRRNGIAVVAANVLPDHVHMIVAAVDEKELDEHVGRIKGFSSYAFQRARDWPKGSGNVWAQKFNRKPITDDEALKTITEYILNNHLKHEERWGDRLIETDKPLGCTLKPLACLLIPLVQQNCVSVEEACQPQGGFDCVIGNPPYIRIQTLQETNPSQVAHLNTHYHAAGSGNYDIYVVFVEKGLSLLNGHGKLGFILPHKFFNAKYGESLRGLISKGRHLSHVVHFGDQQVFSGATTYTALMFLDNAGASSCQVEKVTDLTEWANTQLGKGQYIDKGQNFDKGHISNKGLKPLVKNDQQGIIPAANISAAEWNFTVGKGAALFERLSQMPVKLGSVADIFVGLQTSADDVFIMELVETTQRLLRLGSKSLGKEVSLEKGMLFPVVSGTDVNRYVPLPERQYILFPYVVENEVAILLDFAVITNKYPQISTYLLTNKTRLEERERGKFKDQRWYRFGRNQNVGIQQRKKLCIPRLVDRLYATYDSDGTHFLDNVDVGGITLKPEYQLQGLEYFLGLLNAKLLRWYFPFVSAPFRGGWLSANRQFISQLPIRTINFSDPADKARHDKMVALVEQMLDLNKRKAEAKDDSERVRLQRVIDSTDSRIDALVYELYGLSPEEIAVVENSGK